MDKGETYQQYQDRVKDWQENLPGMATILMRSFRRREDLNGLLGKLHEDQQLDPKFFLGLVEQTTSDGLEEWERQNDDVFDALNKAWKATYWDAYWNSVIGKTGYDVDLAENDFFTQHQEAPDAQALYSWIQIYYGPERFTLQDIQKWTDQEDPMTIQQRQLSEREDKQDYLKRQQVWDMLSWLGPGGRNRGVFETAYLNAGGDPDALTVWYEEAGQAYKTQPEKLDAMYGAIQDAIRTLNLKPPSRSELVRYIQAQEENDLFKQFITDKLGNQFFDYKDTNGTVRPGVFSYYNSLDREGKKDFRGSYSEEYEAIQTYYDMREDFGDEYPTWNDYYGLETQPSVALSETASGSTLTPPALRRQLPSGIRSKKKGSSGGEKPETVAAPSSGQKPRAYPSFRMQSRIGVDLSPDFLRIVGSKMAWEISNLYSSGRRISSSGQSFLRGLAARYPQYSRQIQDILGRT
jgi:hypothetical protein